MRHPPKRVAITASTHTSAAQSAHGTPIHTSPRENPERSLCRATSNDVAAGRQHVGLHGPTNSANASMTATMAEAMATPATDPSHD
jgi:hypothetical protein